MITCNNCLHACVCPYADGAEYLDEEQIKYDCEHFIPQNEWISIDDRLPEDGTWVLGHSAKSGKGGLCNCLKSYVREFGNYDDTTHWLPLPEFPKQKGADDEEKQINKPTNITT